MGTCKCHRSDDVPFSTSETMFFICWVIQIFLILPPNTCVEAQHASQGEVFNSHWNARHFSDPWSHIQIKQYMLLLYAEQGVLQMPVGQVHRLHFQEELSIFAILCLLSSPLIFKCKHSWQSLLHQRQQTLRITSSHFGLLSEMFAENPRISSGKKTYFYYQELSDILCPPFLHTITIFFNLFICWVCLFVCFVWVLVLFNVKNTIAEIVSLEKHIFEKYLTLLIYTLAIIK